MNHTTDTICSKRSQKGATVAVKVTDMLGNEVLAVRSVSEQVSMSDMPPGDPTKGEKIKVAEYRRLVAQRILALSANHRTILAIQRAEKIDDWQLLELERTLTKELGEGDLEVTPENLKKVFAHATDSFLSLVRQVLDMQYLPNYKDLVARQFESYITQHIYNADQIRFLRAVQSVFLQKRHLETADLYEPPLDMFGADAVERWFTQKEVEEVIEFVNRMAIK